jgi:hypothetical protein
MRSNETATIAGLARPDWWLPICKELGVAAFGVSVWTAPRFAT